jgi:hypothetical protein
VSAGDDGTEEQRAAERVDRARKHLAAAVSNRSVVTQPHLDEIARAESELRSALADKERIFEEIRSGKRP